MRRSLVRRVGVIACVTGSCGLAGPVACKCSASDGAPGQSAELCARRAGWSHRLDAKCAECTALAAAPPGCDESNREYSARCAKEQNAKIADKACEPVFRCAHKCKPTACDCVARCFQGQERCEQLAAAVERCVAEVCAPFCQ